ncbi:hypothetical protein [uncultured Azohydromonas sp.]|jgi:hypothetical protein|uniref:hypothetical protein n=1 Tax=uncultured Azohydromonas sp. TaxID=487342 RepID=UPI00262A888F|nr:hypothetical protein [uncultured Azohydromonas sp.]
MNLKKLLAGLGLGLAVLASALAADEHGHDHDHDHGAPAQEAGAALPRFAAVSETFELVGIVNGTHVALYLDRFEDNAPVTGARIELEIGGAKLDVEAHEGAYEATLAEPLKPGVVPVMATVWAGDQDDLLMAEIDVHEAEHADEAPVPAWRRLAPWVAALAASLAAAVWIVRRVARRARTGGAA